MKRTRMVAIVAVLLLAIAQSSIVALAGSGPDPADMAVYIKNNFTGNGSAVIDGDLYTALGNVTVNWNMDGMGDFYHKTGTSYTHPLNGKYTNYGLKDKPQATTSYNETFPALANFPIINNYVPAASNASGPLTISQDTHFGTLSVSSNVGGRDVTFDVQAKDLYVVVDNFTISVWKEMNIVGTHRLFLYINNANISQKFMLNNPSNLPNKLYVISKSYLPLQASVPLVGHLFYSGISNITTSGYVAVTGSIITDATTVSLNGSDPINGLFYAPYAAVSMSASSKITGRLVADSLSMTGSSQIIYSEQYSTLDLPEEILPPKYTVTALANPAIGGTIMPASAEVESGQVIQFTVNASPGYVFTGFTSSDQSMVPDQDNKITVTGDVTVTANFATEQVHVDGYKHGILGTYYDSYEPNEPAKKVMKIDSNVAFNWEYDQYPHATMGRDNFSVVWEGKYRAPATGTYKLKTLSDDGVKLWIDGNKIIENWGLYSFDYTISNSISLTAGQLYDIRLEYQQGPLYAAVFLFWEYNGTDMGLVPNDHLFVADSVHDAYSTPVLFNNSVSKSGTGFENKFYSISAQDEDPTGGTPALTETNNIAYNWGSSAPGNIETDMFFGTMEGWLEARFTENLTLVFIIDDAIRVWVNGTKVIDEWGLHNGTEFTHQFQVQSGQKYHIKVEYADFYLSGSVYMGWESGSIVREIVPKEYMYKMD